MCVCVYIYIYIYIYTNVTYRIYYYIFFEMDEGSCVKIYAIFIYFCIDYGNIYDL